MKTLLFSAVVLMSVCPREASTHGVYSELTSKRGGCCGEQDCKPIDVNRVQEFTYEWVVDGKWHFDKNQTGVKSPDGQYHMCIIDGVPRCLLYPVNV